jgi:hypothetical protein
MKFDSSLAWKQASAAISANREVLLALSGVFFLLPGLALALFLPAPEPVPGQSEKQAMAALQQYYLSAMPFLIPMALIQAMGTLALLTLFTDRSRPTVGQAIKLGLGGILPFIAAQLLFGLTIVVIGWSLLALGAFTGSPLVAGLGIAIVILLAIYGWIKTSLVAPIVAVERVRNPVIALQRSWRLTKGNSVRIGLFYLLLLIVFMVLIGVITIVVGIVLAMVASAETGRIAGAVVSSAITAVMTLYFVAVIATVHRQLAGPSPEAAGAPFE